MISATPIVQQVAMPREVCSSEQLLVQPQKSGVGAAIGAIAGGAVGNAFGSGSGRALATFIGMVGGVLWGERVEGVAAPQVQQVRNCTMQSFLENRIAAYNVLYEYGDKQYSIQTLHDPGPTIPLQLTPVGAVQQMSRQQAYGNLPGYGAPVHAPKRTEPLSGVRRTGGEDFSGH